MSPTESAGDANSIARRISNIEANIAAVKARTPAFNCYEHEQPIQLVCFGPSLRRTWDQLDRTKRIATVSGAHDFLRGKGIVPGYHIEFDWRPHKARFITDPKGTVFLLASCVDPSVVAKAKGCTVALWHAEQSLEESEFIKEREARAILIPGGACAGIRAVELLIILGHRTIDIHGMDCSIDPKFGGWAGQHFGERKATITEVVLKDGQKFLTTGPLAMYADQFFSLKHHYKNVTLNLHGDGMLQAVNKMEMAA